VVRQGHDASGGKAVRVVCPGKITDISFIGVRDTRERELGIDDRTTSRCIGLVIGQLRGAEAPVEARQAVLVQIVSDILARLGNEAEIRPIDEELGVDREIGEIWDELRAVKVRLMRRLVVKRVLKVENWVKTPAGVNQ
jgi:hypothetical protein